MTPFSKAFFIASSLELISLYFPVKKNITLVYTLIYSISSCYRIIKLIPACTT
ncbi:MAG: hypothetical protein ACYDDE_09205 [bacterium]